MRGLLSAGPVRFGLMTLLAIPLSSASLESLPPAELDAKLSRDAAMIPVYREGIARTVAFTRAHPELFRPQPGGGLLRGEQKEVIWSTWRSFLDYLLALDSLGQVHGNFHKLKAGAREQSFLIGYGSFLAKYRAALEFIESTSAVDIVLNEPVSEMGLPRGSYERVKLRFLNAIKAGEFLASESLYAAYGNKAPAALRRAMDDDRGHVWHAGQFKGGMMTAANALQVLATTGFRMYFPAQAKVSEWMGDTKVWRPGRSLISAQQIAALRLEPGDILLERREWFLSNIGLPGFWPHAALYLGTAEERLLYFNDAPSLEWARRQGAPNLDALLETQYPQAYRDSLKSEHNHPSRVLEAMSEGVVFTTIEHSADADALAVLRPRLSKRDKAIAIWRAFRFAGRPYDFNFDFATDAEIVCTELVYKAYEQSRDSAGLRFPLVDVLGRKVTPANIMVKQFDEQFGSPAQQADLIVFLDGQERTGRAIAAGVDEFRRSWKRPKWHIVNH